MTLSLRTLDELQQAPQMATLPALSASLHAVCVALDIAHPDLLDRPSTTPIDTLALLLRIHLDECQQLLRDYDELLFDFYFWSEATPDDEHDEHDEHDESDDDLPF